MGVDLLTGQGASGTESKNHLSWSPAGLSGMVVGVRSVALVAARPVTPGAPDGEPPQETRTTALTIAPQTASQPVRFRPAIRPSCPNGTGSGRRQSDCRPTREPTLSTAHVG